MESRDSAAFLEMQLDRNSPAAIPSYLLPSRATKAPFPLPLIPLPDADAAPPVQSENIPSFVIQCLEATPPKFF